MNNDKWEFALGMIKIDGLEPSSEFLELIEKEKKGEITTADMKKILDKKYSAVGDQNNDWPICISGHRYFKK